MMSRNLKEYLLKQTRLIANKKQNDLITNR